MQVFWLGDILRWPKNNYISSSEKLPSDVQNSRLTSLQKLAPCQLLNEWRLGMGSAAGRELGNIWRRSDRQPAILRALRAPSAGRAIHMQEARGSFSKSSLYFARAGDSPAATIVTMTYF